MILGLEGSGVVDAVGKDVNSYTPGEAVFGLFWPQVFEYGTFADYLVVPADASIVLEGFVSPTATAQDGPSPGPTMLFTPYASPQPVFTVTAITRTRVAELSRQSLSALFARYPEVQQRFSLRLQQYRDAAAAAQTGIFDPLAHTGTELINPHSDAEARAGLRSLVGGGVVEGTEVLVIDLDKCIHCNECEEEDKSIFHRKAAFALPASAPTFKRCAPARAPSKGRVLARG